MADEEHDILITQFQDITGQENVERSRFYLESSGWDLDIAIGSFYEADDNMEVEDFEAVRQSSAAAAAAAASPPAGTGSAGQSAAKSSPAKPKEEQSSPSKPAATGASSKPMGNSSNINTFSNRFGSSSSKEDDEDSSDSDEDGQAFYAGGSETSGQQILGPAKKKDGADFVKHMFKKAKEHGAEAVDPSAGPQASGSRSVFTGAGMTLGSNDISSRSVQGASSKKDEKPREFALKMWQNGFSIDDGPLRAYNDQQNKEFLNDVMMGRIPRELVREARGGEVMVNMEDHKDQPYEAPKVKVKPFQGSGNVLGSIAPAVAHSMPTTQTGPTSAAMSPEEAQKKINVDTSKPMTTIQVRLPETGGRIIVKLNETNLVRDLRLYMRLVRPEVGTSFTLHTTFPNKELTDELETLKDAGVLGAAVLMRYSK